ncbi:ADP-ribosylation factor-like protein 4C [Biomphalaria pfeifferi]|uniref:ADP-ribosylation factor-like protein 4C n=1 Tax=Biomphalaria pfeifferi TaxID=112525 RepID=A0AAD8BQD6_BIOPF|nr:ADP-ribosylation factor-like protein 4C [Biomphalaria pfeifferi]
MGGSHSVQIVMVGLEGTGKTTLLYRLKFKQYTGTIPTIGFNCEKVEVQEGKARGVTFTIWDIGGKDNMRPLWKSYLRSANGILFVVDSSSAESSEEARMELMKLVKTQNPQNIPTLVVANKQDLPSAMSPEEVSKAVGVEELSRSHPCKLIPTCSVTGEGLTEAMDMMYEMIKKWKKGKGKAR